MPTPWAIIFARNALADDPGELDEDWLADQLDRFAAQRGAEVETQIARDSFERGVEVGELLPRKGAPPQTGGTAAGERPSYTVSPMDWRVLVASLKAFGPSADTTLERDLVASIEDKIRSSHREGAEAMREACAHIVESQDGMQGWKRRVVTMLRALPIPGKTDAG